MTTTAHPQQPQQRPHSLHPLWQLVLSVLFAVGLTWLLQASSLSTVPTPRSNAARIVAVHSQLTADEALRDHVPAHIGTPTHLPIAQGWQKRNLWVHLRLQASGLVWLEMTPPRLTLARLHYQGRDGQWHMQENGAAIPVAQREVGVPLIVFALDLPPGNEHEVWVEIRSRSPLSLSFALHQPDDFLPILTQSVMGDVLALGAVVVLGAMAFGVSLIERDGTLWLLGCRSVVVAVWTLQQTGLLSQVFPPAWVGPVATEILLIGQLTLMAQLATAWSYLRGCALPRWGDAVYAMFLMGLGLMLWFDLINMLSHPFIGTALVIVNAVGLIFSMGVSAWLVWRRHILATVVLVTSLVALLFYLPVLLRLLGWAGQDVVVQRTFSPVPTLVILVLLFAGSVIQLQRSRREAQRTAMAAQAQQILWLEERVSERTAELQTAKNLAEQLNAAKSVFLAKVSHELRAPMHTILGYVDLASREPMSVRLRHLLQVVQSAGQQLRTQIEDLLDFARLERAQLRLQPELMSVADLHQMVVELAWSQAADSGNTFSHHLDTVFHTVQVKADARRLEQVLMILLTNAFRYTQGGQVRLSTECVRMGHDTLDLRFVVSDTGRGIRPEALSKIFEAFERGDTIDGDGLGLGLSIAQPLLALMHSHLEVSSQVGIGSHFSFVLTLAQVSSPDAQDSSLPPTPAMPPVVTSPQDWLELTHIAHNADLSALDAWCARVATLPSGLEPLVWALDFEGIERFASAQHSPPTATPDRK